MDEFVYQINNAVRDGPRVDGKGHHGIVGIAIHRPFAGLSLTENDGGRDQFNQLFAAFPDCMLFL
jgi:hypothetical protein